MCCIGNNISLWVCDWRRLKNSWFILIEVNEWRLSFMHTDIWWERNCTEVYKIRTEAQCVILSVHVLIVLGNNLLSVSNSELYCTAGSGNRLHYMQKVFQVNVFALRYYRGMSFWTNGERLIFIYLYLFILIKSASNGFSGQRSKPDIVTITTALFERKYIYNAVRHCGNKEAYSHGVKMHCVLWAQWRYIAALTLSLNRGSATFWRWWMCSDVVNI